MERSCQAQLMAEAAGTPKKIAHEHALKTRETVGSPLAGWFSFEEMGATAGDLVLIAGKGHEALQVVGKARRRFDDRDVARAALQPADVEAVGDAEHGRGDLIERLAGALRHQDDVRDRRLSQGPRVARDL